MDRKFKSPASIEILTHQPTDARTGVQIAAAKDVNGKWQVTDSASSPEIAKGVISTVAGRLVVHLVDSFNHKTDKAYANRVYTTVPVFENARIGYAFDEIDVNNSTPALFGTTIVDGVARPNMLCEL